MFCLTCQRAEAMWTYISHLMMLTIHPQRPYLSVFLIRMALKMCSRGVFSCSWVGCTKGCRAASEKPCWYSSRSWAGRSRREASLTAEDRGSSAVSGERRSSSETHPKWLPYLIQVSFPLPRTSKLPLAKSEFFPILTTIFKELISTWLFSNSLKGINNCIL